MIYPNKKSARQALNKAIKEIRRIEEECGGWISDYEYYPTEYRVTYLNEKGQADEISKTICKSRA